MNSVRRRLNIEDEDTALDLCESNGEDRDTATGRFLPGNCYGHGNPMSKQVNRLRAALLRAVDEDDVDDVIRTLVRQAKAGDVAAAKVLLERLFGKPAQELLLTADTSQYGDETYL